MTYDTIEKQMTDYISKKGGYYGREVMDWLAEFSEWNYEINKLILACLYTNDDPAEKDYDEKQEYMIKKYAQRIHDRGGLTALQSNYYIMSNFMRDENVSNHIHQLHISNLQAILDGVGDGVEVWRY